MLLLAGIAWGAMPINPSRMRGRHAAAFVAAAGPLCNVVLAMAALVTIGVWLRFLPGQPVSDFTVNAISFLEIFGKVNVALALFNLIPVPPLDGSRILADLSRGFRNLMNRLAGGGRLGIVFLVLFYFSGTPIFRAADRISDYVIVHVTQFHAV